MNPLINRMNTKSGNNPLEILSMLKTRNPDEVARTLCNVNPSFRQFYETNKGKPVSQICSENGIDISMLRNIFGK